MCPRVCLCVLGVCVCAYWREREGGERFVKTTFTPIIVTLPSEMSCIDTFMEFWFLHTCKEHSFSLQMIMIPKLCKSAYRFKSYWWISGYLGEFHLHTTVSQQLQFKMPETVIKHHIWPLKVMFLNWTMPEAPDFCENWRSIFLTCRSKIVAHCMVTGYQCETFCAVGSHLYIG